jgi:septal ring factor EnvC (AmiA/AmiB activator)
MMFRFALVALLVVATPVLAGEEEDLDALRSRIKQTRAEVEKLRGEEKGILKNLMKLDEDLGLTNRLLTGLETKRRKVEAGLVNVTEEAADAEGELGRRRELLRRRLRALYQFGGYHELEVLLGSESVVDLVGRFDRFLRVVRRDDDLYRAVLAERARLREAREELASRERELRLIESERTRERVALMQRKRDRKKLLESVQGRRAGREELVAELEESSRELERIIAEKSRSGPAYEPSGPSLFEGGSAKLPWPATGKIVRQFGRNRHPEFGTVVTNNGIDIAAPLGAEIRAVAPGRVEYVSTLPGYGNCVIVRHGGGYYTLYAHASEVAVSVGDLIEQGSVIGAVGNTGSVSGSSLHFEIRKGTEPIDPLRWLR